MTRNNEKTARKESLEATGLFIAPILLVVVMYSSGILIDINLVYYAIYSFYIIGSIALVKINQRELSEIGLSRLNISESLTLAIGFVIAFVIVQIIRSGLQVSPELTLVNVGVQIIFNFVFSGLGQEILFRGILMFSIWRWKDWKYALVISSILFGGVHILKGATYVLSTAIIGLFYGYVTYRTRNIIGPIVAHGLYNFLLGFILTT